MAKPPKEMSEEPGVFDFEEISANDAELDAATLRGLADIEAGRVVSHEAVKRWMLSWGTDNPLPRPKWGESPQSTFDSSNPCHPGRSEAKSRDGHACSTRLREATACREQGWPRGWNLSGIRPARPRPSGRSAC